MTPSACALAAPYVSRALAIADLSLLDFRTWTQVSACDRSCASSSIVSGHPTHAVVAAARAATARARNEIARDPFIVTIILSAIARPQARDLTEDANTKSGQPTVRNDLEQDARPPHPVRLLTSVMISHGYDAI